MYKRQPLNCFIDIQAGAGGTEAQDWASMLLRMYIKYGERKGYSVDVLEESEGDVAGIKTATIKPVSYTHLDVYKRQKRLHPPRRRESQWLPPPRR